MSVRLAQRLFAASLIVAGATALATGPAQAAVASGHVQPANHGENCNNDPASEFAMDPYFCPSTGNADAYDGQDDYPGYYGHHGYPGRY